MIQQDNDEPIKIETNIFKNITRIVSKGDGNSFSPKDKK
jgi:hypothetical protein